MKAYGRVYIGPEPDDGGPHAGYRGEIQIDALGVHITEDCEYLPVGARDATEWAPIETKCLLPWPQVFLIEWGSLQRFGSAPIEESIA